MGASFAVIYPFRRRTWTRAQALEASAEPAVHAGMGSSSAAGSSPRRRLEGAALIIAFIVLAIALVSLLAAALPVITAILGVGIGMVGITALTGVMTISRAPILATMLGLAVGIDYALFILSATVRTSTTGSSRGRRQPGDRGRR